MANFPLTLTLLSAVLHAGWNLLAGSQRSTGFFLRLLIMVAAIGLVPALVGEFNRDPLLPAVWRHLIIAGCSQSIYYIGLSRGYQRGDFTVVYPLTRAAPVLVIGALDVARGQAPSLFGWMGLILISLGCVLAPLRSLREFALKRYWNATTLWIAVAALGTIGYTAADSGAAKLLLPGPDTAVRYQVFEASIALFAYWVILSRLRVPLSITGSWGHWRSAGMSAIALFCSYALILWAFQLSPHTSYIVAVRQFSVLLGVVAGGIVFREPAVRLRLVAALLVAGGTLCMSRGG